MLGSLDLTGRSLATTSPLPPTDGDGGRREVLHLCQHGRPRTGRYSEGGLAVS